MKIFNQVKGNKIPVYLLHQKCATEMKKCIIKDSWCAPAKKKNNFKEGDSEKIIFSHMCARKAQF
jgi:hypothetical protein